MSTGIDTGRKWVFIGLVKVHLAFSVPNAFGGFTSGHVCGREHSKNDCVNNVTTDHAAVTCKLCSKVIADPKHWRHRRYVSI